MFYDPRGQVIRTVNPDGSEQRVIYGVPARFCADPERDVRADALGSLHLRRQRQRRPHASRCQSPGYQHHWNTPASVVVDALGRTVETVERNGAEPGHRLVHHPLHLRHPRQPAHGHRCPGAGRVPARLRPGEAPAADREHRRGHPAQRARCGGQCRRAARQQGRAGPARLRRAEPADPALGAGRQLVSRSRCASGWSTATARMPG